MSNPGIQYRNNRDNRVTTINSLQQLPDGIYKPISDKKSLLQLGQISWYSSVQSSSTFRYRLANKPLYIFRFKKIEQGQLSYPKICPYYFSCSNSNQDTKLE